uniref:Aminotransferase class V domain-containing protein n=1 Tax=Ciona savignyi TaxID=51511 RepID=H2YJI2_CIOSA
VWSKRRLPIRFKIKKKHFLLSEDWTFVNHGAFGAVLKEVLECNQAIQRYIELQPLRFLDRELFPLVVHSQKQIAEFVGCKASDIVFVENATTGTNSILNSLSFNEKSVIYCLDTTYGAVKKSMTEICKRTGATVQMENLTYPIASANDIISLVESTLCSRTTLAVFDHIPSNMGFVMPVQKLVEICHKRNVPVLIDGAHAIGTLDLNIPRIGCEYYVTNLHKWFCAAKGCAIMYVCPDLQDSIKALNVSHGSGYGFHAEHTFTGLKDYSPYISAQVALNFWIAIGPEVIRQRNSSLLNQAVQLLLEKWRSHTIAPIDMHASMCCAALPSAFYPSQEATYEMGENIQNILYHKYKIEIPIKCINGKLYCRISVHLYNEIEDY